MTGWPYGVKRDATTLFVPFSEVLCVSLMGSGDDVHISAARFGRTGFGHELRHGRRV